MSVGDLVRVWTDVGGRKPVPLLAKIEEIDGVIYTIRYLSEDPDHVWRYEEDTYDIDDDSIAEYLKTSDEEDAGFRPHGSGFVKIDSDEDYVPDSDDEDEDDEETESDDEELDDEDEANDEYSDDEDDEEDDEEESLDD